MNATSRHEPSRRQPQQPRRRAGRDDAERVEQHRSHAARRSRWRKKQLAKRGTPDAALRLGIRGGGCSGFCYVIEFDDEPPRERDHVFEFDGVQASFVDKKSLLYLGGYGARLGEDAHVPGLQVREPEREAPAAAAALVHASEERASSQRHDAWIPSTRSASAPRASTSTSRRSRQRHRELSRALHPDKLRAGAARPSGALSLEQGGRGQRGVAHAARSDPPRRGAPSRVAGVDRRRDATSRRPIAEFLMEMMEQREALAEARASEGSRQRVATLGERDAQRDEATCSSELARGFRRDDGDDRRSRARAAARRAPLLPALPRRGRAPSKTKLARTRRAMALLEIFDPKARPDADRHRSRHDELARRLRARRAARRGARLRSRARSCRRSCTTATGGDVVVGAQRAARARSSIRARRSSA